MTNSITSDAYRLRTHNTRPGLFPDTGEAESSPITLLVDHRDIFQPENSGLREELLEAGRLMEALRSGKGQTTSAELVGSKNATYFVEATLDGRTNEAQQLMLRLPCSADPISNAIFFVVGQEIFVKPQENQANPED